MIGVGHAMQRLVAQLELPQFHHYGEKVDPPQNGMTPPEGGGFKSARSNNFLRACVEPLRQTRSEPGKVPCASRALVSIPETGRSLWQAWGNPMVVASVVSDQVT